MREPTAPSPETDVLMADLTVGRAELVRRFRRGVQRALAVQLSSGHPVYYCGVGADTGKLFMRTPDGRRFEYRVLEDGTHEIVRELAP